MRVLLITLLLASCAQKSLENVGNKDFSFKAKLNYKRGEDHFKWKNLKNESSFTSESLSRLTRQQVLKLNLENDNVGKAVSYCYQGQIKRGFSVLDRVFKNHREDPSYWNQVGTCFYLQGDKNAAKLYYETSNQFHQKYFKQSYIPALNNLGVIYHEQGDKKRSLAAFSQAYRERPRSKTSGLNLALIYLENGLAHQAVNILQELYSTREKDTDVLSALGTAYLFKRDIKRSLKFFGEISSKDLSRFEVGLNYSLALAFGGEIEKAYQVFRSTKKAEGKKAGPYYREVRKYMKKTYQDYQNKKLKTAKN